MASKDRDSCKEAAIVSSGAVINVTPTWQAAVANAFRDDDWCICSLSMRKNFC